MSRIVLILLLLLICIDIIIIINNSNIVFGLRRCALDLPGTRVQLYPVNCTPVPLWFVLFSAYKTKQNQKQKQTKVQNTGCQRQYR